MNLLFITKNFSHRAEKSTVYLIQELQRQVNLFLCSESGDIHQILTQLPVTPDFILLNDFKPDYCPKIYGLSTIGIPKGSIMHDLKFKVYRRSQFFMNENIQHIFTIYRDATRNLFPSYQDRTHWFPHHVPTGIFRDYQLPKEINYLMMGAMFRHLYPVRVKMLEALKNEPGFVHYDHPGYGDLRESGKPFIVGESYAKLLNSAKIFITCDSNEHFPLLKYYEVLASNTLLLATASQELSDLGFIDGETFIAVDERNVLEKARYYLHNEGERMRIARQGFEMVRSRHSTEVRVAQLLHKINEIIKV